MDGWTEIMHTAMDITGKETQPRMNASWWNAGYFILVIFFGALFMLQLFVSVVISMYMFYTVGIHLFLGAFGACLVLNGARITCKNRLMAPEAPEIQ